MESKNIETNLATPDSNLLVCNYYEGDCSTSIDGGTIAMMYASSDQKSNVVYKGNTYLLYGMSLVRKSMHSIDGKFSAGELILSHINSKDKLYLTICIPVSINVKKTSFGTLLKKVPNTVHGFQSPKSFVPSGVFYSYQLQENAEQIVFASSNVNITTTELNLVPINSFKMNTRDDVVVYKHSQPTGKKAITFGDDNVYIDCQPIDAPESSSSLSPIESITAPSISFTNLQDNKFIQMLLMFIIFMIVMVIFFYSYEFTTGMFRELTKTVAKMNPL